MCRSSAAWGNAEASVDTTAGVQHVGKVQLRSVVEADEKKEVLTIKKQNTLNGVFISALTICNLLLF